MPDAGKRKPFSSPNDAGADAPPTHGERRRWPRPTKIAETGGAPSSPALQPLNFSTLDLAPADQFAAWQSYLAPLIDIKLPDGVDPEGGFPASHTAWNLGSMLIVQQDAPAHSYQRTSAKLRSSPIDHWQVVVLQVGRTWTEVEGSVCEGEPEKVEFRSLGYPFRGRATNSRSLSIFLPRELFTDVAAGPDIRNNTAIAGNYAKLLIEYIDSIEANLANLTAQDLLQIVQTTRDMMVTCVSSSPEASTTTEMQGNLALMERVRRYVQRNLSSPGLTPDALCRELGTSRTRLYQLFEPSGGVHHYIQKRRLLSAHAALSNPVNRQQIIEIAAAVGYTSAAHFSRAFSKEFGYSPREARSVAVPPYFAHAVSPVELAGHSFDDWLKSLGH
ncbi:AraC family transcriptional regulator [Phyllobacterium sp. 0TCS1.6C]|uniref:helix-turn-helix domain-containing protein n=1 Tax=unclassified Phyllobacterium TaxID=2638441 RepID=UPI002264A5CE|nr:MULTISPECIES: AraC family transcriptional regulator [unclassified Phyllobacterium]MCX8279140.1 AraC family transcriptional regulator [Phyllobacterium sp. 0TCS1.6C]MCX8293924.1 AraC family transcriptional regulator [Phyllobacterium sp. 0TCS1.6A]